MIIIKDYLEQGDKERLSTMVDNWSPENCSLPFFDEIRKGNIIVQVLHKGYNKEIDGISIVYSIWTPEKTRYYGGTIIRPNSQKMKIGQELVSIRNRYFAIHHKKDVTSVVGKWNEPCIKMLKHIGVNPILV